jgi:hypothetical protein
MSRKCTEEYNKKISNNNPIFYKKEDINDFLKLGKSKPCFEIMKYIEFIRLYPNLPKEYHAVDIICAASSDEKNATKYKTLHKIAENASRHFEFSDSPEEHIVLVKHVSKDLPIVLAHLFYEASKNNTIAIHYICKCSGEKLSKSCLQLPKVASLMIYYVAFEALNAKKNKVHLVSDINGGNKLVQYYKSLGFTAVGTDLDGTDMEMTLKSPLSFTLLTKQ